jgi:hypothetical protein
LGCFGWDRARRRGPGNEKKGARQGLEREKGARQCLGRNEEQYVGYTSMVWAGTFTLTVGSETTSKGEMGPGNVLKAASEIRVVNLPRKGL